MQSKINATKNLTELRNLLNNFTPPDGQRAEDVIDLCDLPTFGGVTPSDTIELWSWDAENVLLYHNGEYYIEKRDPDAWYDRNNAK